MQFKKRPRSSRTLKSLKKAGSVLLFRVFFGFRKERVWCNIRSTDWTNYTSICQKDIEGYYYRNLDIWSIRNGDLLIDREYSKVIPSVNNIFDTLGIILKEHSIFFYLLIEVSNIITAKSMHLEVRDDLFPLLENNCKVLFLYIYLDYVYVIYHDTLFTP